MIALICKQTSYKLKSTFPIIIVETLASFSFLSLSMLISKTFMPKQTRATKVSILFLPAFSEHFPARREYRMCTKGTQVPCEVPSLPTRKGWPHHWGLRPLLFSKEGERSNTCLVHETTKFMLFSGSVSTNYDLDFSHWIVFAPKKD